MARSKILDITNDLQDDSGSVLWSFIQGEQNEFPITLNFLATAFGGYTYEAVVVEGYNIYGIDSMPTDVMPNGVEVSLIVRVPVYKGDWSSITEYSREDVVLYNNVYYKLFSGVDRVSAITPDVDPLWEEHQPNVVYVQFPKELSTGPVWSVQPTPVSPVRGFFELRVTEPDGGVYTRTWKPLRGVVEIRFSPTALVPDV